MSRPVLIATLALGCATTQPIAAPQSIPCTDSDADRCLLFLDTFKSSELALEHALERYCVQGSFSACQRLAERRRDTSLSALCSDGAKEACPIPTGIHRPLALLEQDCRAGVDVMCRAWWNAHTGEEVDPTLLEPLCKGGVAQACFQFSEQLVARPDAGVQVAERAKALSWRACLAGVRDACLTSDIAINKCAKGDWKACQPFVAKTVFDERATGMFKSACEHGAVAACVQLYQRHQLSYEDMLERSCREEGGCRALLGTRGVQPVMACERASEAQKDRVCGIAAASTLEDHNDALPYEPWASDACQRGVTAACEVLVQILEKTGRSELALVTACDKQLTSCEEQHRSVLTSIEACRMTRESRACLTAAKWFMSVEDHESATDAYEAMCFNGEVLGCEKALAVEAYAGNRSRLRDVTSIMSLQREMNVLQKGCELKNPTFCRKIEALNVTKVACAKGSCVEWALILLKNAEDEEAMRLLKGACIKGSSRDCQYVYAQLRESPNEQFELCAKDTRLCPKAMQLSLDLWRKCTGEHPAACSSLLDQLLSMNPDARYFDTWLRESPSWASWARKACDAGAAQGCVHLAGSDSRLVPNDEARAARVKACQLGVPGICAAAAANVYDNFLGERLWGRGDAAKRDANADSIVRQAIDLSKRGCDLGDSRSCELQAEYSESLPAGEVDPLEIERLRSRARELPTSRE